MKALFILLALALVGCASNRPLVVAKTDTYEMEVTKTVQVDPTLTDISTIPVPASAPRDTVWKDPATGKETPTARIGAVTEETTGLRQAIEICFGRLTSIATVKPKEPPK